MRGKFEGLFAINDYCFCRVKECEKKLTCKRSSDNYEWDAEGEYVSFLLINIKEWPYGCPEYRKVGK